MVAVMAEKRRENRLRFLGDLDAFELY